MSKEEPVQCGEQSLQLKDRIQQRIYHPTVSTFFDRYLDLGLFARASKLLASLSADSQSALETTLATHVHKEKPVFISIYGKSLGLNDNQIASIATAVDLLWAISLIYDDMFDEDTVRSGVTTVWTTFGKERTIAICYEIFEKILSDLRTHASSEIAILAKDYVQAGLDSLGSHVQLPLSTSVEELYQNYHQRNDFNGTFGMHAIAQLAQQSSLESDNNSIIFIRNLNLASQLLNDLKDIDDYYNRGYSDIRNGVVTVPISHLYVSLSAEEQEVFLKIYGSKRDLTTHPYITFLLSTYAHAISAYDFGVYSEQAAVGKKVFESLVPEEKLLQIGYPSEVDVPKQTDMLSLPLLWNAIILGDTRVFPRQDKDHFLWDLGTGLHLPAILSRRENKYRTVYHEFFRLDASDVDVVNALKQDANQWSNNIGYLARIDLEAPLFNEVVYPNGSSTGPRIDLWQALNAAYAKSPKLFISMNEFVRRMNSQDLDTKIVTHDRVEDPKWQFNTYKQEIASLGKGEPATLTSWYAWLSTHHSDYFCTEKDDWIFKTCDGGTIRIVKQQIYREPELQAKLELLRGQTYSGDNKVIGDYLARMQTVYQYLAERGYELTS